MLNAAKQPFSERHALIFRAVIGVLFGLVLAYIQTYTDAHRPEHPIDPSKITQTYIWHQIAFLTVALSAFIYWAGAAAMRRAMLLIWGLISMALIAVITWTQYQQNPTPYFSPFWGTATFLLYPLLFIGHELISSADQARKPIAPYSLYFDEAWKRGVQLCLCILFTLLLWGILWLGASLLGFIGFDWFKKLLEQEYFSFPVTGLALGISVHLSDVQTKLLANVRALILGVLSWLLPVIVLVGLIFTVSLCFSGLEPLWKTKAATATLLGACLGLVLLINAAYQQGDVERPVNIALKIAARIGCGLILIFSVLAAYALSLRIGQYGLTPARIMALVGVIVALLYGIGYAVAAVMPGRWLRLVEPLNIAFAIAKCVIFIAVLTPIATPARLSVNDQVARLQSGKVAPDQFDWNLLRFETGVYGTRALDTLEKNGTTDAIRKKATEAKTIKERYQLTPPSKSVKPSAGQFKVIAPADGVMPATYLTQSFDIDGYDTPQCMKTGSKLCQVSLIDLNRDTAPEIVMLDDNALRIYVFEDGKWQQQTVDFSLSDAQKAAFLKGETQVSRPEWDYLMIGDKLITPH
ncbi:DUF4153 domain-containing protein [Asticcacaulis endophyticus]|uniref:DUF4153 domain-containing protein n=1 Tax=Asticcacaulis endophyticus TaxID=1395890 RepID=A0A918QF15_9CAUL|nr:DUF4153 domain-containing protein [Asticcacaulis endophyticus]GGZ44259.1 DUF4153 domain-containing protein [Asticcacaulis endophyticus]